MRPGDSGLLSEIVSACVGTCRQSFFPVQKAIGFSLDLHMKSNGLIIILRVIIHDQILNTMAVNNIARLV